MAVSMTPSTAVSDLGGRRFRWFDSLLFRRPQGPLIRVYNCIGCLGRAYRQKNNSAEDGIDGTIGLSGRNSGCSAEHKTLGIPFRTIPQRRRMLGIMYHGTKIEANSRNSALNHSAEQKTLEMPFRNVPHRRKMLGIPFRGKK
jgi:hypothetical protein